MSEKLRNCPFCGGKARLNEYKDGEVWYEVWCDGCAVRTEQYETEAEAIEKWNRRADTEQRVENAQWAECEVLDSADYEIPQWQSAKCSNCGKYHTTPYKYKLNPAQYCPNCGARMENCNDK